MSEVLTATEMRRLEGAALDSGEVTGLELMERAARGAVAAILAQWPAFARAPGRATVLCGPGNNGGDGFAMARLLRDHAWDVEVFFLGDADRLPRDARTNFDRWVRDGAVHPLSRESLAAKPRADLVIDAIFGIGLKRPIGSDLANALHAADAPKTTGTDTKVVAIDVPSGVQSDTGNVLGHCLRADLTVTFHRPKLGHFLSDGPDMCGALRVVDIGLGQTIITATAVQLTKPSRPLLTKTTGHKFDHGHALVLTGGMGRTGAARLAARGALRIGAGLVTLAAPGSAMMECAAQITAIMLRRCNDCADLADLLQDRRINAICLGPGAGVSDRLEDLLDGILEARRPCVLDADALTALAARADLMAKLHDQCILTPHGGEFGRLFPDIVDRMAPSDGVGISKVGATRQAAAQEGCTVLFKGPATVIADPSGTVRLNAALRDDAAPWLATAGSGDVLAGIITGLLARGLLPLEAASQGAWIHAAAARAFGPGLVAEDLPEALPPVLASLTADG
ncbi:MAG: NAD(P)H-hydrate dehydratase [Pseudomonadota bacterium]